MLQKNVIKILKTGSIGVLATDTIYGLVGSALNKKTVERVYKARKRNPKKPCIILIGSIDDLAKFAIKTDKETAKVLNKYWGGKRPTSIILPHSNPKFKYLHRGTKTLAFRLPARRPGGGPKKPSLIKLLKQTGPLIAPSANPEGWPPAKTIAEARAYFGEQVDFYLPSRSRAKAGLRPSKLIKIENSKVIILRK